MQVQLVMADDDATPSNPPVAPVQQEEFKEAPLDLNVSQRPHEEEPPRRVVQTRVDRSVWDHRLSPNPHALVIYLEFVPARGAVLERFEECQSMMSVSIVERGFPVMAIIVGYEARSTHFPWSIESSTSLAPFVAS
jgi:hypothetical protein